MYMCSVENFRANTIDLIYKYRGNFAKKERSKIVIQQFHSNNHTYKYLIKPFLEFYDLQLILILTAACFDDNDDYFSI